jgi:hypothetical protein
MIVATDKADKKERDKDNKEFAVQQLAGGTPHGNIALLITLANLHEVSVDEVKKEFDASTKLVQEAFRSL